MATRIFCDHCGNTIRDPIVFCFGPHKAVQDQIDASRHYAYAQQGVQYVTTLGGNGGVLGGGNYYPPTVMPPQTAPVPATLSNLEKVDLCQHCVSTWMSRVRNLTKESDA